MREGSKEEVAAAAAAGYVVVFVVTQITRRLNGFNAGWRASPEIKDFKNRIPLPKEKLLSIEKPYGYGAQLANLSGVGKWIGWNLLASFRSFRSFSEVGILPTKLFGSRPFCVDVAALQALRARFFAEGVMKRICDMGKYKTDKFYPLKKYYRKGKPIYLSIADFMLWLDLYSDWHKKEAVYRYVKEHKIYIVEKSPDTMLKEPVSDANWEPPESGVIKINVDGSFSEGKGGWAAIYRDECGNILKVLRGRVDKVERAYDMEIKAFLEGLKGAELLGYKNIIIETDCDNLLYALDSDLKGDISPSSPYAVRLRDINILCKKIDSKEEGSCRRRFCPRESNTLADHVSNRAMKNLANDQDFLDSTEAREKTGLGSYRIVQAILPRDKK